jgi:hypothetical protein
MDEGRGEAQNGAASERGAAQKTADPAHSQLLVCCRYRNPAVRKSLRPVSLAVRKQRAVPCIAIGGGAFSQICQGLAGSSFRLYPFSCT